MRTARSLTTPAACRAPVLWPVLWLVLSLAGALMAPGAAVAGEQPAQPSRDASYGNTPEELVPYGEFGEAHRRNLFPEPLPFHGPGREGEDPEGLSTVDLGLLAPGDGSPEWREGLSMKRGAILAVEKANAAGGYKGTPFRLLEYEDLPRWGASSNTIVKMAYEDQVWAALGSVSGDSSHIAIRVALKALLPMMNSAAADPTLTETGIPWAFRCISDARQESYALARTVFAERGLRRVAVIRANSRFGRMGITELRDAAKRLGYPLVVEVNWIPGQEDLSPLVERVMATRPDGLVIWGGAEMAGRTLAQARAMGLDVPAFGPSRVISDRFLTEAGAAAEGFVAAASFDPSAGEPRWLAFREVYRKRWDEEPDAYAAHAFDGMNLVLGAVREAGLNRVRIRDALANIERYEGATGEIVFDNTFNDVGPVYLATVEGGMFRYRHEAMNDWTRPAPVTVGLLRPGQEVPAELAELRAAGLSAERGAGLAIEERKEQGESVRLVSLEVQGPWSTAAQIARDLMVRDGADAVLTVLDHAGSHAAAQVATKLRRPLVTVNDPSVLLHYTGVPWVAGPRAAIVPQTFESRYQELYGEAPDDTARAAYLATGRLLAALERGTERALAPTPSPIATAPTERAESTSSPGS